MERRGSWGALRTGRVGRGWEVIDFDMDVKK